MRHRYRPTHITSTGTAVPVLPLFNTTSTTAIAAPGLTTITLASMAGIQPWSWAWIYGGTGTPELVQILGGLVPPSTSGITQPSQIYTGVDYVNSKITAVFQNTHSGTYNVVSQRNNEIGTIDVGNAGTTSVLTLYDGPPAFGGNTWGTAGSVIKALTLDSTDDSFFDEGMIYNTLFYTISGSGFDVTIWDYPHGA